MTIDEPEALETIWQRFEVVGRCRSTQQIKRGHINDTYLSEWEERGVVTRFIHQCINEQVFKDVAGLMQNVARVLTHVRAASARYGYTDQILELVPARSGDLYLRDGTGKPWRTYRYIEGVESIEVCTSGALAEEAAAAFSRFQRCLLDLPAHNLIEVIPKFHNVDFRIEALREAVAEDRAGRVSGVGADIEFAINKHAPARAILAAIADGAVPIRATHNDLKLNNVLFRKGSEQAVCVVDLDTCMPGSLLYDFGDLARCTAVPCAEDEPNLDRVQVDERLLEGLIVGYLRELRDHMTQRELELMAQAPFVLALTLGVRFLTDYLRGDVYFKVDHPEHNLQRARTQFTIAERFEWLAPTIVRMIGQRKG